MKVAVYIDGFNMYHAINELNDPPLKWLNLYALSRSLLRPGESLVRVAYFSAHVPWDKSKRQRHVAYVRALESNNVDVFVSQFEKVSRYCKRHDRNCPFHEEKQSDVNLAITAISDGFSGVFDKAILITADSDQIPTVEAIRALRPQKSVKIAPPPGRKDKARDLIGRSGSGPIELKPGRLRACLLPRNIDTGRGEPNVSRPAAYHPPGFLS